MHVSAEQNAVSLPKGALKFTLVNRSKSDILYTPCQWAVYNRSDSGWKAIRSLKGDTSTSILSAGVAQSVTLTLYVGRNAPSGADPCGYSLDGLDAGRYLFGVAGTTPEGKKALFLASFRAKN